MGTEMGKHKGMPAMSQRGLPEHVGERDQPKHLRRESDRWLRLALDSAGIGTWEWNPSTGEIWLDEQELRLFGIRQENFSGRGAEVFQAIHPEDLAGVHEALAQAVAQHGSYRAEFRVIHENASVHWLAGRGQMLADSPDGSQRMIGVSFDITERKLAEQEHDQYTRLENVAQLHRLHVAGEFAALLAHQLNQPLTAIRSFAEAGLARLRRGLLEAQQMHETLEDIVAQSDRAATSIRDLRKFLARQPQEMIPTDLNAEVRAACNLMEVLARGRRVRIELDLAEPLPPVPMRASQIGQVIINLMENAMDAINHSAPEGGTIGIGTRFDPYTRQVVTSVVDSGAGLNSDSVTKVFDPLYTTKKNGIGMGLAISRSIVENHGGRIWAEPGSGGRFLFSLPATP